MKKLVIVLLAACAVAACSQKELAQDNAVSSKVFKAVIEQAPTKVYNDGLNLYWKSGDLIAVYDNCDAAAYYEFAGADGSVKGDFTLATSAASGASAIQGIYAVYPSNNTFGAADNELAVYVYDDQTPSAVGVIDTKYSNVMVAYSDDESLSFRNIGGFLHLSLYGEGTSVSQIIVTGANGEILSGDRLVSFDSNGLPVSEPYAGSQDLYDNVYHSYQSPVSLGASASDAVDFYFILPPGSYSSGFNVEIVDQYNQSADFTVSSPVTIYRNKMTSFPALEVKFAAVTAELVCGAYTIEDADSSWEESFTLSPTADSQTYFVNNLGGFGLSFYAYYDAGASTLTLDGTVQGYESMGSIFNLLLFSYSFQEGAYYGPYIYTAAGELSSVLVFNIDPDSKQIVSVNESFRVIVYDTINSSILGYFSWTEAGTSVRKESDSSSSALAIPKQSFNPDRIRFDNKTVLPSSASKRVAL